MTKSNSNMSPSLMLDAALAGVPKKFRERIVKEYRDIKKRFSEAQFSNEFDSTGISTGKFVEIILRLLQFELTGSNIPFGQHIPNLPDECRKLIQLPKGAGNESLRIIIPRALAFLYTLRGKRGIGHTGGDVEANAIDAATVVRVCDWIVCELIRVFHGLSLEEAQALVDALSARNVPDIWQVGGKKRVLRSDLTAKEKTLLLVYAETDTAVLIEDLFDWVEYSNLSVYKKAVLEPLHKLKLIEYDKDQNAIYLSPLGVQEVESKIISKSGINAVRLD